MKKCIDCNIEKSLEDFYKHPQNGDGRAGKCKECCKKQAKERFEEKSKDPIFIESEKERGRNKYHRLYKNVKKIRSNPNSHRKNFPEKYKANTAAQHLSCPEGYQKHHWSYNEEHWKDIILLPIEQHYTLHRLLIYDQEFMMYRKLNNELLDSKELHESYINEVLSQ